MNQAILNELQKTKSMLVYLETLECRLYMTKESYQIKIKEITEKFRELLRMKEKMSPLDLDPLHLDENLYN